MPKRLRAACSGGTFRSSRLRCTREAAASETRPVRCLPESRNSPAGLRSGTIGVDAMQRKSESVPAVARTGTGARTTFAPATAEERDILLRVERLGENRPHTNRQSNARGDSPSKRVFVDQLLQDFEIRSQAEKDHQQHHEHRQDSPQHAKNQRLHDIELLSNR